VDRYLSASGYLPEGAQPFFVALPKEKGGGPGGAAPPAGAVTGGDGAGVFRAAVQGVDREILRQLREDVEGGFDEEAHGRRLHSSTFRLNISTFLGIRWVHDFPPVY
jgi:hypothetical protein